MKRALSIIRYVLTWPLFLGWLFPGVFAFACKDHHLPGDGLLVATWRDWVVEPRRFLAVIHWPVGRKSWENEKEHRSWWKYSTTISRGMILQQGASEGVVKHERVHVRQAEDIVVLALFVSIAWAINDAHGVESWLEHLLVWSSGVAWQAPNFLLAVLRGQNVYRRASHEDHAYGITNVIAKEHVGKSWEQIFDEEKRGL
jgi:hypothetical protein